MRRLVLLYDGTWNTLQKPDEVTNVVRVGQAVKTVADDGVQQVVYYNSGVGSGGRIDSIMGGLFGAGIKSNVKRGLTFLSFNYDEGGDGQPPDEIYIFGFSRGAYTARALAGVIGSIKGIPKVSNFGEAEELWSHYKKSKHERAQNEGDITGKVYTVPAGQKIIKCVAVWDTVGSYGIPTGLGLTGLARSITSWTRNFRDNEIGKHIAYGFHAMAIDERRRSFSTTAWVPGTNPHESPDKEPVVEQVWFAGAHANVGGGYKQTGLSDQSLVWMMARIQDQTGLEFDEDYISKNFWPCSACSAYRSYKGWWVSSLWPSVRSIPKRLADAAGAKSPLGEGAILDGRVHWSVRDRQGRLSLVDQDRYETYRPKNLMPPVDWAEPTDKEKKLIALCHANDDHKKKKACALRRVLENEEPAWWQWQARSRVKRMRKFRENWAKVITP
jgi:uncharacterized protein (DUF2235 family)